MAAADRPSTPLIDIASVVIAPVLVMMMVGSLVFFLISVIYRGPFTSALHYTFFFFVIGTVLIARLTIQYGRARSAAYAAGLGGACLLAMLAYVQYDGVMRLFGPLINIGLMALVWWSANKLTWDCTHLDEDRKASGRGLLAATGLDAEANPEEEPEPEPVGKKRRKKDDAFVGWVERYKAYQKAQQKKPHTPGTWVLYFALAALPLFALGQALIPADDGGRRRATFLQMAVYVGSALGLLVTTTLMGLRKYLDERGAKVPQAMTVAWLGMGAALIVAFLLVGSILPRPYSETPLVDLGKSRRVDRNASEYSQGGHDSTGKGKGKPGGRAEKGQGKGSGKGGEPGGGKSGEKGSGGQSDSKNSSGGSKGKAGEKGGKSNEKSQGKGDASGKKGEGEGSDQKKKDDDQSGGSGSDDGEESQDAEEDSSDDGSADTTSATSRLSQALESVGDLIQWIVWAVIAVAVVIGVVVFVLKWLAPFTNWARNLLDWLRGLWKPKERKPRAVAAAAVEEERVERPPPYAVFSNPFADGSAEGRDPAELVEYTFAALDAWAWDRDRGRKPGETPLEFAVRLGHEYPDLDEPAYRTAELVVRVLYSERPLPADTLKVLDLLWDQLERAPRAVSRIS